MTDRPDPRVDGLGNAQSEAIPQQHPVACRALTSFTEVSGSDLTSRRGKARQFAPATSPGQWTRKPSPKDMRLPRLSPFTARDAYNCGARAMVGDPSTPNPEDWIGGITPELHRGIDSPPIHAPMSSYHSIVAAFTKRDIESIR